MIEYGVGKAKVSYQSQSSQEPLGPFLGYSNLIPLNIYVRSTGTWNSIHCYVAIRLALSILKKTSD